MSDRFFASPAITAEHRPDDTVVLSSRQPLEPHPPTVLHAFRAGSIAHPDRTLVAEPADGGWNVCTWRHARTRVDRIAQGLLDRGVAGRPILILSRNSISNLLLTLAAYTIGSPVVPTSVAYSLQSTDHAKLRAIAQTCEPAAVFAEDANYAAAVRAIGAESVLIGSAEAGCIPLADIEAEPTMAVNRAFAGVGAETTAKIMFTSGSTGTPKGVINTHRMLAANQQQMRQVWPFLTTEPPVLLDWLPWSHTFGGNHNVGMVLVNHGSLWIDTGRPTPDLIARTIDNLADVQPTVYFNVPAGYAALVPILERDPAAAKLFFAHLRIAFFAAAALPQELWDRLESLAAQHGSSIRMTTSWGMTETAPAATTTHFSVSRSDSIGVPLPGVEAKLLPVGAKYELLVRGPNVTPGFYRRPDLYTDSFDAEGFLRTGDLVSMVDPAEPDQGLLFGGRIAENFKLSTGTFVNVGTLRPKLLSACAGLLQDAVICGQDGEFVAALAWTHPDHAGRVGADGVPDHNLRAELADGLARLAAGSGSSQRVERLLLLTGPPELDAGEITDKGYINQRAVRENRAHLVAEVCAAIPSERTICREASTAR
ncbi:feruloyl-CoA synthase [Nocardia sp. CA-135398]|uniref:feruloyl-CoA synthase n=1 Tax=Nocardia sp. CA-135398 TaxID=3239977 RepID=UPI003D973628